MKKTFRAVLSILLVFSLFAGMSAVSFAQEVTARLYNVYGDNMLFQQKKEVILSGTATGGAELSCGLFDEDGNTVVKASGYANKKGGFSLCFTAPEGGFKEYTVKLFVNGTQFDELNNVVFGELWLASGQSNMQYGLAQAHGMEENYASGKTFSKWLRTLLCPAVTPYKGNTNAIPADPQKEIEGAQWVTGENIQFYNISAVAYFFAEKLMQELNMPVGILNASLGGSSISSWISRDAIDSDRQVKSDFVNAGEYIDYSAWNETKQNMYNDMSANFNNKINALRNFRISGMIWYQGETNAIQKWEHGRYSRAFDLMQRSYTETFSYQDGLLPIIYTSLASCAYNEVLNMLDMNLEFVEMQQARPESRALISIYDIPLDYISEVGAIHPSYKQPIGERMAYSAMGLVYGKDDTYTTAAVKKASTEGDSVYVTFSNVGSGLTCGGDKLSGFSVCGADGVYVQADAQIVSEDTIRIYSELEKNPVSAAYAHSLSNQDSNLFAKGGDGTTVPVASFVTDKSVSRRFIKYTAWNDCESATAWRCVYPSDKSGEYDVWEAEDANVEFVPESAFSGTNGMHITTDGKAGSKTFTVSPKFNYHTKGKNNILTDIETDYSDYGKLTFKVRNDGETDVDISSLRIYTNAVKWFAPSVDGAKDPAFTIPADGQWYTVTYDLNSLYLYGNEGGGAASNEKLKTVKYLKIHLKNSKRNSADISVDEFRFTADTAKVPKKVFEPVIRNADNPFEFVSAIFFTVIGSIVKLFS